jgi:hypothetical protein
MKIKFSGILCGSNVEFNRIELRQLRMAVIEITSSCSNPVLTRDQVIELRDFLSAVIADTYLAPYLDDLEER